MNKPVTLKQGPFGGIVSSCKREANHTLEPDFDPPVLGEMAYVRGERAGEDFF